MVVSKKDRRHSGRVRGRPTLKYSKSFIINNCLEPREFWNDWTERRDGTRGYPDNTKKRSLYMWLADWFNIKRWNKKIKKQLKIRKARKHAKKIKEQTRPR